jgi:hypothetical protein
MTSIMFKDANNCISASQNTHVLYFNNWQNNDLPNKEYRFDIALPFSHIVQQIQY